MLYNGEQIGDGRPPLDRHRRRPHRRHHADRRSAGATPSPSSPCRRKGTMFDPGPVRLHGEDRGRPRGRGRHRPRADRRREPAASWPRRRVESVRDLTAVILDRDRHADIIAEVRAAGARIRLIPDGDVAGAISTAWPESGADILFGIGGTPEGVIAAAALQVHGRRACRAGCGPATTSERAAALEAGYDLDRCSPSTTSSPATTASSPPPASPTASCCEGVHYDRHGGTTQSLVMRSRSGTVRRDRRPPPPRQARHLRGRRLRLTSPGGRTNGHGRVTARPCGFGKRPVAATPVGTNVAAGAARRAAPRSGRRQQSGGRMKVGILAGGLGTRLAEETELQPKPMVEIGGMPDPVAHHALLRPLRLQRLRRSRSATRATTSSATSSTTPATPTTSPSTSPPARSAPTVRPSCPTGRSTWSTPAWPRRPAAASSGSRRTSATRARSC